jgi:hypothetical protein
LTTVCLAAFLLLIAAPSIGQDYLPSQLYSAINPTINTPDGSASISTHPATPATTLVKRRVIDKKFIGVMGALGGAETLRFTSRKLVLDNEFAAGAPWVTTVPSNQNLVAKYAGLYATEFLVAYELKKSHAWLPGDKVIRKLWWAYPSAMGAIHVKNGLGNIRTQGPSGCTSVECAMQMQ